jgi:hypothetical protein
VINVGELTNLVEAAWLNDEFCACGRQGSECPFWQDVYVAWKHRIEFEDVEAYLDIQKTAERYRRLPGLIMRSTTDSKNVRRHKKWTQALYASILEASGKSVIVDSSKDPVRAFALAQMPEIDLRLVHLVRDGRGFTWSVQKSYDKDMRGGVQRDFAPMPMWRAAVSWSLANIGALGVCRQVPRDKTTRVHYEDFVTKPERALKQIGRMADLDFAPTAKRLAEGTPIGVGHVIAGNRVRMSEKIELRPDMEWQRKMPPADRSRFFWLTAPLMKYLGYSYDG